MGNYNRITTILEKIDRNAIQNIFLDLVISLSSKQEKLLLSFDELVALYVEFRVLSFVYFNNGLFIGDLNNEDLAEIWISEVHDFRNRISKIHKNDIRGMTISLQRQIVHFEMLLRSKDNFSEANDLLFEELLIAPYRRSSYQEGYFYMSSTVTTPVFRETLAPLSNPEKNLRKRHN